MNAPTREHRRRLPPADPREPHLGAVGDRQPDDAAPAAGGGAAHWKRRCSKQVVKQSATAVPVGDERRAMQLFNPGLNGAVGHHQHADRRGAGAAARRDRARHRHSPSAIRFIMQGNGAYTAVEGEKVIMHEGDLVLTPNWPGTTTATRPIRWWCGWTASTCRSPRRSTACSSACMHEEQSRVRQAGQRLAGALRPRAALAPTWMKERFAHLAADALFLGPDAGGAARAARPRRQPLRGHRARIHAIRRPAARRCRPWAARSR